MSHRRLWHAAVRRELSLATATHRRGQLRLLLPALLLAAATPAAAELRYRQEIIPAFSSFDLGDNGAPTFGDLDADGDLDLVAGDHSGRLQLFENTGDPATARFVERRGPGESLFAGVDLGEDSRPALGDFDSDSDLDLVVGESLGRLFFFANTGTSTSPAFVPRTGSANPFAGFDAGNASAPALADLDAEGDLDVAVGNSASRPRFLANTGNNFVPAFVQRTGSDNPLPTFGGTFVAPGFADIDGDGDLDLAAAVEAGSVIFYENTGLPTAPAFLLRSGINDPFFGIDAGSRGSLACGDLDADGDPDAALGEAYGSLHYLEFSSEAAVPFFRDQNDVATPFAGADPGEYASPALADLDGDGDLDAAVGTRFGTVSYYENTGGAAVPAFVWHPPSSNPFDDVFVGHFTSPELADLDGDGDFDVLLGEEDGGLSYFENTGSPAAPAFVNAFKENPFVGHYVGSFSSLEVADLDGDGDLDALAGREEEGLVYFANTGSATAAAFVQRSGSADPFAAIATGGRAIPVLGDLDGDHDLDLLIGGGQRFFENTGNASAPAFIERGGGANPFDGVELGRGESPELADLDGDGDLDALIGEDGGRLVFFRAFRPLVFSDGFEDGSTGAWSATFGSL